jgi:hypothetical protein
MKKKFILILALVLLAALAISVISVSASSDLVGLKIKNRTDGVVWVSLLSPDNVYVYWLEIPAGQTKNFTVPKAVPPNPGERTIEKIHFFDSPDRGDFQYQFD